MGRHPTPVEEVRDAVGRADWRTAYELLTALPDPGPRELDALADAAWWLCRVPESIEARQSAYAGFAASGQQREAARAAWMVFFEHQLSGHESLAAGWLTAARRHLLDEAECAEHALVEFAEAVLSFDQGDVDRAAQHASTMSDIAVRCGDRDLAAMGLEVRAEVLVARGHRAEGLGLLDEAMRPVLAGELGDLFTGWIYCRALPVCLSAADVRRAGEWTESAMAWCASLPAGTPYHGICRVHRVEVLHLRGDWDPARLEAERACAELLGYDPGVAGEAFYVAGEIRARMGDTAGAERAFLRAHELGRDPQPGLALLRLQHGHVDQAALALAVSLAAPPEGAVRRARLLAARVDVELARGGEAEARAAADELAELAATEDADLLRALAAGSGGAVLLAREEPIGALRLLRQACALWLALGLPYEVAQTRMLLGATHQALGDRDGAQMELAAALAIFDHLGATPDARRAAALLPGDSTNPGGLTPREVEVLRLVAAGGSNRSVAHQLVLSEHTVARHLNNIFAKLGVRSRSAATAFAFQHRLL